MELFDFAYCPKEGEWLVRLAGLAVREYWGESNEYLLSYCSNNFEIAWEQKRVYIDPRERFAVFRCGHLLCADGTPIFLYFERNRLDNKQAFYLKAVIRSRNLVVRYRDQMTGIEEQIAVPNPTEPVYNIPPYQPGFAIDLNPDYEDEFEDRIEKQLGSIANPRVRHLSIFGATELAHRLWRQNAIPQYFRARYQYLLPLHILGDDPDRRPDLLVALEEDPDRMVYIARTILTPEMAWPNARSIAISTHGLRGWVTPPPRPEPPDTDGED